MESTSPPAILVVVAFLIVLLMVGGGVAVIVIINSRGKAPKNRPAPPPRNPVPAPLPVTPPPAPAPDPVVAAPAVEAPPPPAPIGFPQSQPEPELVSGPPVSPPADPFAVPASAEPEIAAAPEPPAVVQENIAEDTPASPDTFIPAGILEAAAGPHAGETYPLTVGANGIGRRPASAANIVLDRDQQVSGLHGVLVISQDGSALYRDASRNGSRVNGQILHQGSVSVASGARIEVGQTLLSLTLGGPTPLPASPEPSVDESNSGQTIMHGELPGAEEAVPPSVEEPSSFPPSGSTLVGYNAALEIVEGPDRGKPFFNLAKKQVILGRGGADLIISDPTVSAQHAVLTIERGQFILTDNGSTNGTLVNDEPLDANGRELKNGDRITLGAGHTVLVFHRYI